MNISTSSDVPDFHELTIRIDFRSPFQGEIFWMGIKTSSGTKALGMFSSIVGTDSSIISTESFFESSGVWFVCVSGTDTSFSVFSGDFFASNASFLSDAGRKFL